MMESKKGLMISIGADTSKLQSKLKIITKHLQSLSDELESIDIKDQVTIQVGNISGDMMVTPGREILDRETRGYSNRCNEHE